MTPHSAIFEQLPWLAHRQPGARARIIRASNGAPAEPTAPLAATPVDAEQIERDWYFAQLLKECREGHVRPTRISWLLAEAGRTENELNAALAANCDDGKPATSQARQPVRVLQKELTMTESEKKQVRSQWDTAVKAQHDLHPTWPKAKCISKVATENPALHQRLLDAANS